MHVLVTGGAGFIGSGLSRRLLADGHGVTAVDCFTGYYDEARKRSNIRGLLAHDRFELVEEDLRTCNVRGLLVDTDIVFHQAGQPGVRLSWAEGFETYVDLNIHVTQRLLEAARSANLKRFVYASSSSIYGQAERYPTSEVDSPAPRSPYGVTKLAGEHLAVLYAGNFGIPTVSLRYFTVYGPRQRPDMATQRLVECAVDGRQFNLYGDGSHVRDFTFVDDVVEANVLAAMVPVSPGAVYNVSGGSAVSMSELIEVVSTVGGQPLNVVQSAQKAGDVRRTGGDSSRAFNDLGWKPQVPLEEGVRRQFEWYTATARHA
jgi:nucleoside-diphosphate-sugar epimerase